MAWSKEEMAKTASDLELKKGMYVNLGIGIPTLVANYIDKKKNVILQGENGILGMGPFPKRGEEDPDLLNASKQTITSLDFTSYFDSSASFAMIRGGHIDLAILGAMQVSKNGDIANWTVPGKMITGMGGAMDLVANVKRVIVMMEHVSKNGAPKILNHCTFPLTGSEVVSRIITDLGVFDIDNHNIYLVKKPEDVSIDEIISKTEALFEYRPLTI